MPNATHIQKIGRLARELAEDSATDLDTAILGMSLTPWHEELAAVVADVPTEAVRQFVEVHRALKGAR